MKNIKVSEISKQSVGKWNYILQRLGIKVPEDGKHGPCPKCGGKDRFRFDNKDGRGTWFCNQCGNGDGIDIVKRVFDIDTVPAAARVAECLPFAPAVNVPARKEAEKQAATVNWSALLSQSVTGESPYLAGKGLTGHVSRLTTRELNAGGEKYPSGSLMLPVKNTQGNITGIQLISGNGVKNLMKGSKYSGCFIPVSDFPEGSPEKVVIAEGYGTAVSVSLLSDAWPLAALSKTNLKAAAEAVREKWPEAQIIIAGDNDFIDGKPNEGREVAIKAALAVKGWVSIPPGRAKADWDDYRRDFGVQRAREAFAEEMFNPGDTETRLPPGFRLTKEFLWCERTHNDGSESGQMKQIKILKPSSVNRYINRLSGMFTALIKIGVWSSEHPVRGISRLYVRPREMAFLSKRETAALLQALEGDYYRVALLCLSTGARWSEASTLKGEQVVHNRVTFLETKNGKMRTVPISQIVSDTAKKKETGALFDVKYCDFCQILKKIKPDLPKGQAAHVLRHTFASHFVMNGGNIIALQRILGHATIQQTMAYAHFAPDYLADAVRFNPIATLVSPAL